MCLQDHEYVRLTACPHGALQLRVGNTTLHLTNRQALAVYAELSRCVASGDSSPPSPQSDPLRQRGLGRLGN